MVLTAATYNNLDAVNHRLSAVPVEFEDDMEEYKGKIHRSVTMRCPAIGVPKPTITWFKVS